MSNGGWYRSCTWLDEASKREDLSGVFFSMIDAYLRRVDMSISAYLSELHKRATGKEIKNGGAYYSVKKVAEGKRILFPYLVDNMVEVFSKKEREYLCWYYVNTKKGDVSKITAEALKKKGITKGVLITGRKFYLDNALIGVRGLSLYE